MNDAIKFLGAAFVGALATIFGVLISNWQANRRLKLELRERQNDRIIKFSEKLSDHIIKAHADIFQRLVQIRESLYFHSDYASGEWSDGIEQPGDLLDIMQMFSILGELIRAKEIWLDSDCIKQLAALKFQIQVERAVIINAKEDDGNSKYVLTTAYGHIIEKLEAALKSLRQSIGLETVDSLVRAKVRV